MSVIVTVQGRRKDIPLRVGDLTDVSYGPVGLMAQMRVVRIVSRRRRLRGQHDIYLEPVKGAPEA